MPSIDRISSPRGGRHPDSSSVSCGTYLRPAHEHVVHATSTLAASLYIMAVNVALLLWEWCVRRGLGEQLTERVNALLPSRRRQVIRHSAWRPRETVRIQR